MPKRQSDDLIPQREMATEEAAQYIAELAEQLARIARRHGLNMQAYTLEIAAEAAREAVAKAKH